MENGLSALEEFEAQRKIRFPHCLHLTPNVEAKKRIAYVVLAKKEDEILLIEPSGFAEPSVLAGLSSSNLEYFSKNASVEYKKILWQSFFNENLAKEIFEIAKSMDDDLGRGSTANTQRIKGILKYLNDNRKVFSF